MSSGKALHSALTELWNNKSYRFLILFIGLFLAFYYFNILYIGITSPGGYYSPFLDQYFNYVRWWRRFLIETSATIIRPLGYDQYTTPYRLHVDGRGGIVLVYSCLGYGVMSAFAAFVLAWPQKKIKEKLPFLIFGLVLIQLLNLGRLVGLSLYARKLNVLNKLIDHHDLFNLIVYTALIVVTYYWIRDGKNAQKMQEDSLFI